MEGNLVAVHDVRPGVTLIEDVFVNTKYPIVPKNTLLEVKHLEALRAFNIRTILVAEEVVTREEVLPEMEEEPIDADTILTLTKVVKQDTTEELYKSAVQAYEKEFSNWRAGVKPDIAKMRSIMMPLLEKVAKQKRLLGMLSDLVRPQTYNAHHAISVGMLATAISQKMNFPEGQTIQLGLAAALSDCGMAKVDASIMRKTAFLTKEEYLEVKKHVIYSYQMIKDTPLLRQEMKQAVLQHHERLDGSGYPRGYKLQEISSFAQIIAVADVFHAMTSERIYRMKESPYKVIEMLMQEEFGKFDLKVLHALQSLVEQLTIGTKVQLSDGKIGEVIFVHRDASLRPMIKIMGAQETILDLTRNRQLSVDRVIEK